MVSERDAVLIVDDEPDFSGKYHQCVNVAELNAIGFDNPLTALDYISVKSPYNLLSCYRLEDASK